MRPEYYADEFRRFSEFAHRSPTNQGLHIASGSNSGDYNWTEVLMKTAGSKMDGISLHYYTLPTGNWQQKGAATGFAETEWVDTFANTLKMDEFITGHSAIMDKYDPQKRVGLYVDEWGSWYDVEKGTNPGFLYQQNTLRDGVLAAVNLNIFHHHADRVKMTSVAQTINVLQSMILTDGARMALTPTYYTFKMYVPFQDATSIPLDLTTPDFARNGKTIPALSASAALARDGHIYIGLANMDPEDDVALTVDLGALKTRGVSGDVLTSSQMDTHNEPGKPEAIAPVSYKGGKIKDGKLTLTIPAKSVVVVKLD